MKRQMTGAPMKTAKKPRFGGKMRTTMPARRLPYPPKETGFVDLASASYNLDTTGSIVLLATVPQGASVNQRVGKKVMWKSLQCRGLAINNLAAVANDCAMLIVYDSRPTGALPAITDILVSANSRAMNNDANSGRFKILKRSDFVMVGNSTTFTETYCVDADFYLPIVGKGAVFKDAGTGAIADISDGALYLVTVGSAAAGTSAATLTAGFRTRFVDY